VDNITILRYDSKLASSSESVPLLLTTLRWKLRTKKFLQHLKILLLRIFKTNIIVVNYSVILGEYFLTKYL